MTIRTNVIAAAAATLCTIASVDAAAAQATRTFVSAVGDDANPCSRTAPCRTFAGTISKTATGGEINCIDIGSFGVVTIAKSITIDCDGQVAGQTASTTTGIVVNPPADSFIVLRGLTLTGAPTALPGNFGIRVVAPVTLTIEHCEISNFRAAAPNGIGLLVANTTGVVKLNINNMTMTNNGIATTGGGIQIAPTGSGSAEVVIDNSRFVANTVGVRADSTGTTGALNVSISNTTASHSPFHGFVALGSGSPVKMMLNGVVAAGNAGEGIRVVGANAVVRMGLSTVTSNAIGVQAAFGGVVQSYGDNRITGNTNDGVVPTIISQK